MRWLTVVLVLVVGLAAVGCAYPPLTEDRIHYFYDEAHNVSIWTIGTGSGVSIAVLPGNQVKNPQRPAEIIKP